LPLVYRLLSGKAASILGTGIKIGEYLLPTHKLTGLMTKI